MTTLKDLIRDYGMLCFQHGAAFASDSEAEMKDEPSQEDALDELIEHVKERLIG